MHQLLTTSKDTEITLFKSPLVLWKWKLFNTMWNTNFKNTYCTHNFIVNFCHLDIGVNLTDTMYKGIYHGSKKHEGDLEAVLQRAWNIGMQKMIITGGSLEDSREALHLAESHGLFFIWLQILMKCLKFRLIQNKGFSWSHNSWPWNSVLLWVPKVHCHVHKSVPL